MRLNQRVPAFIQMNDISSSWLSRLRVWRLGLLCFALSLAIVSIRAQELVIPAASDEDGNEDVQTAPVVIDGKTLFSVRGIASVTAERRAQEIADRIHQLAADRTFSPEALRLEDFSERTEILAGNRVLMTVHDADASLESVSSTLLAQVLAGRIREAIGDYRLDRRPDVLARGALLACGATLLLILVLWAGRSATGQVRAALERRYRERFQGVHIQEFQIIRGAQLWRLLMASVTVSSILALLGVIYAYLHFVLALFPWTRGLATNLAAIVWNPLYTLGTSLLAAVPDLVFLAVLGAITWYVLRFVRMLFAAVERGTIKWTDFDPRWAKPTNRLISLLIVAFALVVAYPYIPGSNSQAFKGVSLFLGVLFSLGSTSLIGNIISGYTLIYRRTFEKGDRVKIGDHTGVVEQTKLLVTYLRTIKNEIVVVPNSEIVAGDVINYSTLAGKEGLVLHSTVGVGYGTPWRQVEAMLIEAGRRTSGLLLTPPPFVLIKELDDFAVIYEINAYSDEPHLVNQLYATLHEHILDAFNEYGVQIMTPAYEGDPEQAKIVSKDQWYAPPARVPDGVVPLQRELGPGRRRSVG